MNKCQNCHYDSYANVVQETLYAREQATGQGILPMLVSSEASNRRPSFHYVFWSSTVLPNHLREGKGPVRREEEHMLWKVADEFSQQPEFNLWLWGLREITKQDVFLRAYRFTEPFRILHQKKSRNANLSSWTSLHPQRQKGKPKRPRYHELERCNYGVSKNGTIPCKNLGK